MKLKIQNNKKDELQLEDVLMELLNKSLSSDKKIQRAFYYLYYSEPLE